MPRLVSVASALLLVVTGCSRDMAVPGTNRLTVEAATTSVAPREQTTVQASGGAGGYQFAFASGGKLSGATATLTATADPTTIQYQAGEAGSGQDEIEVTDASGATASARIAVSARLAVTPAVSVLAPGESVALVITGGKPDYAYTLAPDPASDATVSPTGVYTAGTAGDVVDRVFVTDATADAGAQVVAEINVGPALEIYPRTVAVAPNEKVSFLAFGGAGSYTFAMGLTGSGTSSVDPLTGVYTAGSNPGAGAAIDTVVVTDGIGRTATAAVSIGARLRISMAVTDFRPGVPVRMSAAGGKAPYVFGFSTNGNRTGGHVDAASGDYTPGYDVGASDVLQVTDATGSVAQLVFEPKPDAVRVFPGESSIGCSAHQLDASGVDAILVNRATMSFSSAEEISLGADAIPIHQRYPAWPFFSWVVSAGTDGDTAHELLLGSASGLREMDRGVDGNFDPGALVTAYTGRPAALARAYSGTPKLYQRELYVAEACTTGGQAGIRRFDWVDHAVTAGCEQVAGGPLAGVPFGSIVDLVAADLDGNGFEDLVWFTSSAGPLTVGFRSGAGFTSLATLAIPAGTSASSGASGFRAVPLPGTSAQGVAMLLSTTSGATSRKRVWFAHATGGPLEWTSWSPHDVNPGGYAPSGIAAYRPIPSANPTYVTWTGMDGVLSGFALASVDSTPTAVAALAHEASFPLTCVVPFRAFPSGAVDLYLGSRFASAADVFYGDGDGRFGRRARYLVQQPLAMGDVDGDGLADVVTATGTPGLRILYGGSEQLAHGPETATATRANVIGIGDFGLGRASVVFQDELGDAWHAPTASDGSALPPMRLTLEETDGSIPTRLASRWLAADLGGEAPGVDLFQDDLSSFGSTYDAWIRYATTTIVRVPLPAIPADTGRCRVQPLPAGNGAGPGAVALCEHISSGARLRAFFSPLTGSGRLRAFGSWSQIPGSDLAATTNVIPLNAGTFGGSAWFASDVPTVSGQVPYLLEVRPGTPQPAFTWMQLTGRLSAAVVADLDGVGSPDVVTSFGPTLTRFFAQGLGTYAPAGAADALGFLSAAPRLGGTGSTPAVLSAGAALDPVTFVIPVPAGAFQ